jgi:multimeric flavodoxin WrbA
MKITCLLGSPRLNGNCAVFLNRFRDAARALGAETEYYALRELNYRGCLGCLACKTRSERCVVHDDLTPVLESVREADAMVMATPVYLREMTSLLRAFVERTYSFFLRIFIPTKPSASSGKEAGFHGCRAGRMTNCSGTSSANRTSVQKMQVYGNACCADLPCAQDRRYGGSEGARALMKEMAKAYQRKASRPPKSLSPLVSYKTPFFQ